VVRAEVAGGGYVNLFLGAGKVARTCTRRSSAPPAPRRPGHVIVEHTSINPNKAAHIGHLRNACLGDTFVRLLRHRGFDVGVQNYIDDTGVQVADVVVGFQHLEKKTLADVERIPGKFDYYCWDLYARVGEAYTTQPETKKLQAEVLHQIEAGGNDTARSPSTSRGRIVDCHLATMARPRIRYELLAHESDILRLHFWDRAFELMKEKGVLRLESRGQEPGLLGAADGRGDGEAIDEDKIIVRSNGTVTYTGKDIAYQLWKLGELDRDFRYKRPPHRARRLEALDHDERRRCRWTRRTSATPTASTT
jgi:arginyl-tRNA synthetase